MNLVHLLDFKLYLVADSEGREYLALSTESKVRSPIQLQYRQTVSPFSDLSKVERHLLSDVNYLRTLLAPSTEQSPICKLLDPQTPES